METPIYRVDWFRPGSRKLPVVLLALSVLTASTVGSARENELRGHVEELAGAASQGRPTGGDDEIRAARYLARQLEELGAEPLPGGDGFVRPFETDVAGESVTGHNVVGVLPAVSGASKAEPWVVLSAHYDHLGRGEIPGSLAGEASAGEVHPGADDNASGVAAVLAAAGDLVDMDLGRSVILAFWSGSEVGNAGSRAFLDDPGIGWSEIAAHVNLHMVGRMRDYRLLVQAVGSSPVWGRLIEQVNVPVGFSVQADSGMREPGDVQPFVEAGIPSVELSTGGHADFHRPTDRPAALDYEELGEVARFAALLVSKLAALPEPPELAEPETERRMSAGGAGAQPFTGTIPDYAGGGEGLRLSGVVPGGPAEAAGLMGGDVIVELAGVAVSDAYDYMEALERAEIGEPMKVVFLRNGERRESAITPTARE